jgi:putrescine aminotransferase
MVGQSELEYFLTALEETLSIGLRRLLTGFIKEKAASAW